MTLHLIRGLEGTGKSTLGRVMSERGYATIETDLHPDLARWVRLDTGEPVAAMPKYVDESWLSTHSFLWQRQKVQELIETYQGRHAFLCGSAANVDEFYGVLGRRFYLWASDGTITKRLQTRNPGLWRYGSRELTRRMLANRGARTEAIMDGYIVINAELPIDDIATDIMAYVVTPSN